MVAKIRPQVLIGMVLLAGLAAVSITKGNTELALGFGTPISALAMALVERD